MKFNIVDEKDHAFFYDYFNTKNIGQQRFNSLGLSQSSQIYIGRPWSIYVGTAVKDETIFDISLLQF